MRIVIAEDGALFRECLVRLLEEAGHEVIAAVADADALLHAVAHDVPDLAVIDIRMPPTLTDDGARAAEELRRRHPDLPMLLLSQHIESRHSVELVSSGASATSSRTASCTSATFSPPSSESQPEAPRSTPRS